MNQGRYQARGPEAEFEPGSGGRVLRNKLGIQRVRDIEQAESEALLAVQEWAVARFTAEHRFAAADVRLLHRQWLGGIYELAGEYRSVNVSKGGFMFAPALQIQRLMVNFEINELAWATPCAGMDRDHLVAALARTHAELVIIHPFREGNGRCARLLSWLMALQAGMPSLDFSPLTGRGKRAYIAAVHQAVAGDYGPMEECFRRVIRRTLKVYQGQA
jgi:cell filamentation protein